MEPATASSDGQRHAEHVVNIGNEGVEQAHHADHDETRASSAQNVDKLQSELMAESQRQRLLENLIYNALFARQNHRSVLQEGTLEQIDRLGTDTLKDLIAAGADPNTAFYLPPSFPVKFSIWSWAINQLCQSVRRLEHEFGSEKALIQQISQAGVASTQCDQYVIGFSAGGTSLVPFRDPGLWDYGYRVNSRYCMVCEVNAKYMLEWYDESRLVIELGFSNMLPTASPFLMWRLSRAENFEDDADSQPEPPGGYESEICFSGIEVIEIQPEDAKFFLPAAERLWKLGIDEDQYEEWIVDEEWQDPVRPELQEIFATANKLFKDRDKVDLRDVLREHGYYKDPNGLAVPKGPIQRLEHGQK